MGGTGKKKADGGGAPTEGMTMKRAMAAAKAWLDGGRRPIIESSLSIKPINEALPQATAEAAAKAVDLQALTAGMLGDDYN
jgi:hypothetical protein